MRAVWTRGTNGPTRWKSGRPKTPNQSQVRSGSGSARRGCASPRSWPAQGLYPGAPKLPAVLGYEAAGVIDKVGNGVDERSEGSHVCVEAPRWCQDPNRGWYAPPV
jgi:synaptic vesicle membrane protein VAT-1